MIAFNRNIQRAKEAMQKIEFFNQYEMNVEKLTKSLILNNGDVTKHPCDF